MVNEASIQSERVTNNKLNLIEQKLINTKDELSGEISKKLNSVTEQILITREVNNNIELVI